MKISNEVRIGILAVVSIFAAVWGYKFLKGRNFLSNDRTFYAYYDYADQLAVSAPVFIKGYEVGTVTDISFDPILPKPIKVSFTVQRSIQVPKNTVAAIVSTGLLGGKAIEVIITEVCAADECAKSGTELLGSNRSILSAVIGDEDLDKTFKQLGAGLSSVVDSLDKALTNTGSNKEVSNSLNAIQNTLFTLESASSSLDQLLSSSSSPLNRTLSNVSSITNNLKDNNESVSGILTNVDKLTTDLAESDLKGTVAQINESVDILSDRLSQFEETIQSLNQTLTKVNSGEGTLGKLIYDEQVYQRLDRSARNLELLLQDIRINPERYIKVSVFGKKSEEYELPTNDPAYQE